MPQGAVGSLSLVFSLAFPPVGAVSIRPMPARCGQYWGGWLGGGEVNSQSLGRQRGRNRAAWVVGAVRAGGELERLVRRFMPQERSSGRV